MKKFVSILMALVFSVIIGGAVSAATGLNPYAVIGGGSVLSALMPKMEGIAPMAIQKEIWITSLVENLFADNSFMSRAFNADEFVMDGKVVHIPNAGSPSNVEKNRSSLPATVKTRNDVDITFNLDEYTTDPIKIGNAEQAELSYNKRESLLMNDRMQLIKEVSEDFLYKWSTSSSSRIIRTTGASYTSHLTGTTGTRKKITKDELLSAMELFNAEDIAQEGRTAMLDAQMYSQLLASLTTSENADFNKQADLAKGVLGKYASFDIMMRSRATRYTAALAPKAWTSAAAATDQAGALLWHSGSVCRALGQTEAFEDEKNPLYYGDIYSFLVRAGGRIMRNDLKGVAAIVQANA